MAGFNVTRQYTLHDGASANSSTRTTNVVWVGDANFLSVSITSSAATTSNWTIQGANVDGFQAAIAEGDWSNVSVIVAQGIYSVTPGFRWLRAVNPAVNSQSTIILAARST